MGRHSARGVWDAAKHPHGEHGHWASTGGKVVRRTSDRGQIKAELQAGQRSSSAFQPGEPGARRAAKKRIQVGTEVARGVRAPRSAAERRDLEWAGPKQIAAQRALTGDARMPRRDAIQRARREMTGGRPIPTVGTKKTFTGRKRRVRDYVPPVGANPTTRGRFNLARYGRN